MPKNKYKIIEAIRLHRDLTYDALAEEIDMKRPTLYNIIRGRTVPNARHAYKIDNWLNKQKIPA